jgi:NAD(P)-dependent dehydrogenase (short-subunit alcohol dehydrogenase family)
MSTLRFDGRVAVVTGGGRGLGRAYALLLGSRGAKVVVNDIGAGIAGEGLDPRPAEEVVEAIRGAGGTATANTDSVATTEGAEAIIKAALANYGRIDILIHNAGNLRRIPLKDYSTDDFHAVVGVHLLGAFYLVRAAFPAMCRAKYGRIVLTGSTVGLYGNVLATPYAVSKAGMIGLCNSIALEGAAEGVKCNLILPGAVTRLAKDLDTSSYPPTMGPELVAPVAAWLSHESCSMTGEMLIAMAGRVSSAYIVETRGVFRDDWTIEQVAENMDGVRDRTETFTTAVSPSGLLNHSRYTFEMAKSALLKIK